MLITRKRRILGGLIFWARMAGLLLAILAILDLPAMQFLTGPYAPIFNVIAAIALFLIGIVWLFGVTLLIRFFDHYLSRN